MLGTAYDRRRMNEIRWEADVVLFGAETLRANPRCVRRRALKGKRPSRQPANGVITESGKLDPRWKFWEDKDITRFVFTTEKGFERALKASQDRAFVVNTGKKLSAPAILKRLQDSSLSQVLVEGGGETMSLFLREASLDELYVTLTPKILGGRNSPSLVAGDAFWPPKNLRLLGQKKVGQELYLHYKCHKTR